jgi:hypothetical protein
MNWLLALGPKFLASKLSGWIALLGVVSIGGFLWYVDDLRDDYDRLKRECLVAISPEVEDISRQLRELRGAEFDALREALDDADHPCLDWEYNPEDWQR